jgi:hypothetical protein
MSQQMMTVMIVEREWICCLSRNSEKAYRLWTAVGVVVVAARAKLTAEAEPALPLTRKTMKTTDHYYRQPYVVVMVTVLATTAPVEAMSLAMAMARAMETEPERPGTSVRTANSCSPHLLVTPQAGVTTVDGISVVVSVQVASSHDLQQK